MPKGAATREINGQVQTVTEAMQGLALVARDAGATSRSVQEAADGVGIQAETLQVEVESFLTALSADTGERRIYERVPVCDASASLLLPGGITQDASVTFAQTTANLATTEAVMARLLPAAAKAA